MKTSLHIVGCAVAREPAAGAIDECLDWLRRHGAEALAHNERELVFVRFDAADAALIEFGCRTAARHRPPLLRFGFSSGIKEAGSDKQARLGERGIVQACDLAGAAQPGQVLLSSQLGSLLQVAHLEPASRLRSQRVRLLDGRSASAYTVDPRKRAASTE